MENIIKQMQEILSAEQTADGAQKLQNLYKDATGHKMGIGCLCKMANITLTYTRAAEFIQSKNN